MGREGPWMGTLGPPAEHSRIRPRGDMGASEETRAAYEGGRGPTPGPGRLCFLASINLLDLFDLLELFDLFDLFELLDLIGL